MFKKVVILSALASTMLVAYTANADVVKPYVGFNVGINDVTSKDKVDNNRPDLGTEVNAFVGARITENYRTELAYLGARNTNKDSVDDTTYKNRLTLNGAVWNNYYDIKNSSKFTPYVGFGLGAAKARVKTTYADGSNQVKVSDTVWIYEPKVGVSYNIDAHNDINLGYNYITSSKGKDQGTDFGRYKDHIIEIGYRYSF